MTLADILLAEDYRPTVAGRLADAVAGEIATRSGLSGIGLRTALKMAEARRGEPVLPLLIDRLLPEFCTVLEPQFEAFLASGRDSFGAYLSERQSEVTEALLSVTDRRIEHTQHDALKQFYPQLRTTIHNEFAATIPEIGDLVQARLDTTAAG
ncbi:hypothetical protein [uncultured Abyssibacter sp.]|uniref:DUF6918 family protein n=1 Tax=uncultured Abyssibacter sp. TaxID=2320202 RepID=UPI0032B30968|tara:strand:- start:3 stop:461 length:459 start_codon:yes stop_codon:yes gene_type:complete